MSQFLVFVSKFKIAVSHCVLKFHTARCPFKVASLSCHTQAADSASNVQMWGRKKKSVITLPSSILTFPFIFELICVVCSHGALSSPAASAVLH